MKSRLFVLLCVSLFLALGVTAACSSGDGDSDEQSLPTATEPAPEAPAETAETTEPRDDDDELTLEEYFIAFEAIGAENSQRLQVLVAQFQVTSLAAQTDDETLRALLSLNKGLTQAIEALASDFGNIDPPAGIKDAHDSYASALAGQLASARDFDDATGELQSLEEYFKALDELRPATSEADQRAVDACLALQEIAEGSGIDLDLGCEE